MYSILMRANKLETAVQGVLAGLASPGVFPQLVWVYVWCMSLMVLLVGAQQLSRDHWLVWLHRAGGLMTFQTIHRDFRKRILPRQSFSVKNDCFAHSHPLHSACLYYIPWSIHRQPLTNEIYAKFSEELGTGRKVERGQVLAAPFQHRVKDIIRQTCCMVRNTCGYSQGTAYMVSPIPRPDTHMQTEVHVGSGMRLTWGWFQVLPYTHTET